MTGPIHVSSMAEVRGISAKGVRRVAGQMNKTERTYADAISMNPANVWWKFESMTFLLSPDLRYTPDFNIMQPDGRLIMVDVKGTKAFKRADGSIIRHGPYIEEDAKVKMKVAPELFPFVFQVAWLHNGTWHHDDFGRAILET